MKLFVFDFDGVLFDTVRECLAVAWRAIRTGWPVPDAWRDSEEPPAELAAEFARHRYLVGPPWQYALLLECIARGSVPASTSVFTELAAARRTQLEPFTEVYFAARAQLAAEVSWPSYASPYAAATTFRELHAAGRAMILSTRDAHSISRLCSHHLGIDVAAALLPRSGPREKWELLLELGRDPASVIFIDDYIEHALPAHRRGFAAYLALWGYSSPGEVDRARAAGLPCLPAGELDALANQREDRT